MQISSHVRKVSNDDTGQDYSGLTFDFPLQLAIFSQSDRLQPHRFKADESYSVGTTDMTPVQAYLDIEGVPLHLSSTQNCTIPQSPYYAETSPYAD